MTKTKTIFIQTLIWIFSGVALQAQTDLPETLRWANNTVFRKSGEAILACEAVLSARDWKDVNTAVQSAIEIIKAMQSEVCF